MCNVQPSSKAGNPRTCGTPGRPPPHVAAAGEVQPTWHALSSWPPAWCYCCKSKTGREGGAAHPGLVIGAAGGRWRRQRAVRLPPAGGRQRPACSPLRSPELNPAARRRSGPERCKSVAQQRLGTPGERSSVLTMTRQCKRPASARAEPGLLPPPAAALGGAQRRNASDGAVCANSSSKAAGCFA